MHICIVYTYYGKSEIQPAVFFAPQKISSFAEIKTMEEEKW